MRARVPTCLACGRTLRKFVDCTKPGNRGRMNGHHPPERTADGMEPTRGAYGDNAFCGIQCGYKFAVLTLASVPGTADLLPPDHLPSTLAAKAAVVRRERARQFRYRRRIP